MIYFFFFRFAFKKGSVKTCLEIISFFQINITVQLFSSFDLRLESLLKKLIFRFLLPFLLRFLQHFILFFQNFTNFLHFILFITSFSSHLFLLPLNIVFRVSIEISGFLIIVLTTIIYHIKEE